MPTIMFLYCIMFVIDCVYYCILLLLTKFNSMNCDCIVESLVLVIVRFANSFSPNDVAIACNYEEKYKLRQLVGVGNFNAYLI